MLKPQHPLKLKKAQAWQYRWLLQIPKNLVYVFSIVILLAFVGMIYIVYLSEQDLTSFISYRGQQREISTIHPLYSKMQARLKVSQMVDSRELSEITPSVFYQEYLT
jgi:hypothetical protein